MRYHMLASALLLATSGLATAQDAPVTADPGTAADHVPGFRASQFAGMNLYVLNPDAVAQLQPADPAMNPRAAQWSSGEAFIAARDQWEDVGGINDIVLSQDGQVQGVLLDIGGFLGIGSRTVLVSIDDLYFVADSATPEDLSDFFVVASMSREQLESLPEWNDDMLAAGYAWNDDGAAAEPAVGPAVVPEPETAAPLAEQSASAAPTAEELTGAQVQDLSGAAIGVVSDLTLSGDTLSGAIIDVGGFLGIGAKRVVVPLDALMVVRDAENSVLRIETTLTRDALEALPEHAG